MTALWAARTAREQVLIALLGLIGLLYVMVVLVWQPLQQRRAALMADIVQGGRILSALQTVNPAAVQAAPLSADVPLPTLVTTTADTSGLLVSRLVPSDNAVEVTLDRAEFSAILGWIAVLEQDHALRILTLTFTRRPEPGVVTTTLTVGR